MSPSDRTLERVAAEATARGEAVKTDPGVVWHYTDGARLLSILRHHVLWATSAAFLNDKDEVALGGQRMAERIQQLAESTDACSMRGWLRRSGTVRPGRRAVAVAVLHPERLAVMGLLRDVAVVRRCPGVVRDRPRRAPAAVGARPARP